MNCGSHDNAMKQAKANANLDRETWVVFSFAGTWYCEPLHTQSMTKTLVFPDSPEVSPFDEMAAYQSGRGVHGK